MSAPYQATTIYEKDSSVSLPALRADIPAMRERAEKILGQREYKDVPGQTAHALARDVLTLLEALQ